VVECCHVSSFAWLLGTIRAIRVVLPVSQVTSNHLTNTNTKTPICRVCSQFAPLYVVITNSDSGLFRTLSGRSAWGHLLPSPSNLTPSPYSLHTFARIGAGLSLSACEEACPSV
jgi:hypothetical protein